MVPLLQSVKALLPSPFLLPFFPLCVCCDNCTSLSTSQEAFWPPRRLPFPQPLSSLRRSLSLSSSFSCSYSGATDRFYICSLFVFLNVLFVCLAVVGGVGRLHVLTHCSCTHSQDFSGLIAKGTVASEAQPTPLLRGQLGMIVGYYAMPCRCVVPFCP